MTPQRGPTLDSAALASVVAFARESAHEGITVADLAEHAGYSPFHFTRLFGNSIRMSPGQFLTALRIDAAKRLLLAGTDPVIDVATAVGFDSLSSFARRFRELVAVPPARLRRLAHEVGDAPLKPFRLGTRDSRSSACACTCRTPSARPPRCRSGPAGSPSARRSGCRRAASWMCPHGAGISTALGAPGPTGWAGWSKT